MADAATATGSVDSLTATFQVVCSKFQDSNFYAEADKWLQRFRFNPSVMPVAQKALGEQPHKSHAASKAGAWTQLAHKMAPCVIHGLTCCVLLCRDLHATVCSVSGTDSHS